MKLLESIKLAMQVFPNSFIMECMNYLNAQYKTEELNNENKKI